MAYMKSTISTKQQKIVKEKVKGKSNVEIGAVVYPNANPTSQRQLVSRQLKKPHVAKYYDNLLEQRLKYHNITIKTIVDVYAEAVKASKQNQFTGEVEVDHNIRMRAADKLKELLPKSQPIQASDELLDKAIKGGDELQLIRVIKNQKQDNIGSN